MGNDMYQMSKQWNIHMITTMPKIFINYSKTIIDIIAWYLHYSSGIRIQFIL